MILQQGSTSGGCRIHEQSPPFHSAPRPFFSVVTASLNNGRSIATALESVKNQTCRGVEHIVIDGGSTDEPLRFSNATRPISPSLDSEPDRGLADAMNKGVRTARGRYVIFIHADDALVEPDILEWVYKQLETERYDICWLPHSVQDSRRQRPPRMPDPGALVAPLS